MADEIRLSYTPSLTLSTLTYQVFRDISGVFTEQTAGAQTFDREEPTASGEYAADFSSILPGDTIRVMESGTIIGKSIYVPRPQALTFNEYQGGIWVDTVNGSTGTVFGINGTPTNPCLTFAAARTIAQANGFATFYIKGGSNIITGDNFPNARFIGIDAGSRFNLQNKDFGGAYFEGLHVYGTHGGSDRIQFKCCRLGETSLSNIVVTAIDCVIAGDLTLADTNDHFFLHCFSGVAGTGTPSITFGGTNTTAVNFRDYSGGLEVKSMGANHTMSYEAVGQLVLNASCTGGTIARRGAHNLVDNSGGAVTLSEFAAVDRAGIAHAVWNEVLSKATYNLAQSAGKRLQELTSGILHSGTSPNTNNGSNRIELESSASPDTGAYDPAVVTITDGKGAGQSREIFQYDGPNRIAYVNRDWRVIPDGTSEYLITASTGDTHVNEGLSQGGNTSTTFVLNTDASSVDDYYNHQLVFIVAGIGADQCRLVSDYDGASRTCTLEYAWDVIPDGTSVYSMLADHLHTLIETVDAVWDDPLADHNVMDTTGQALRIASRGGAIINGYAQAHPGGDVHQITLEASTPPVTDVYKNFIIFVTTGPGAGQAGRITALNGTTKVATIEPLDGNWTVFVGAGAEYSAGAYPTNVRYINSVKQVGTSSDIPVDVINELKTSLGWTTGGNWDYQKLVKLFAAWMTGRWTEKSGVTGTFEIFDPDDDTTVVMEITPTDTDKTVVVKI